MGLTFLSEEQRNPTKQQPVAPPVDPCASVREERDLMNEFLEDMGHAVTYDLWKSAKEEVKKMKQQYNENGGFEEVQ